MIQAKANSTEKRKFILGNVAETWIQASGSKKEAKHVDLSVPWCRAQPGLQQVGEAENNFAVEKPQKESIERVLSDSLQKDRAWTGGKQLCFYDCTLANLRNHSW